MTIISRFSKCHRKLTQVTDSRERACLFARNVVTILQGCGIDHLSANMNNEIGSNSFAIINQAKRSCKTRVILMEDSSFLGSIAESWHRWSFTVNRELRDTLLNTIIEREFNFQRGLKNNKIVEMFYPERPFTPRRLRNQNRAIFSDQLQRFTRMNQRVGL